MDIVFGEQSLWLFHWYGLAIASAISLVFHMLLFSIIDFVFQHTSRTRLLINYATIILVVSATYIILGLAHGIDIRFHLESPDRIFTYLLWADGLSLFFFSHLVVGFALEIYAMKLLIMKPEVIEPYVVREIDPEEHQGRVEAKDAVFNLDDDAEEVSEAIDYSEAELSEVNFDD